MPKRNRHREAKKAAGPVLSPADAAIRAAVDEHNRAIEARLLIIDTTPINPAAPLDGPFGPDEAADWARCTDYGPDYDRDRYTTHTTSEDGTVDQGRDDLPPGPDSAYC